MQIKEYEKDMDILCDRIGEASFCIKEMLEKQSEFNTYKKDFKIIARLRGEEKKTILSMISAMLIVDPNYRDGNEEMSKITYGIFRTYEKEQEEDAKELKRLEEEQVNRKGDRERIEQEREELSNKRKKLQDRDILYRFESISIGIMMIISCGVYLYLHKLYEFAYELPIAFTILVGIALIFTFFQLRVGIRKKQKWLKKQDRRFQALQEDDKIQEVRKKLRLEELYLKYAVNSYREMQALHEKYEEEKTGIQENSLKAIQVGILEALKRRGIEHAEFFINFPATFIEPEELGHIKTYIDKRQESIENGVYFYIMGQKEDMKQMNELIKKHPNLKTYAQTALEGYGIEV